MPIGWSEKKKPIPNIHLRQINVWREKKIINMKPESNNWQIIQKCWFFSDHRHAHRMSDEYDGSSRKKFIWKIIHVSDWICWNLFVSTFYSIVVFVFKWPHRVCCVLLCIVYTKYTVCMDICTLSIRTWTIRMCLFFCLNFNASKDQM